MQAGLVAVSLLERRTMYVLSKLSRLPVCFACNFLSTYNEVFEIKTQLGIRSWHSEWFWWSNGKGQRSHVETLRWWLGKLEKAGNDDKAAYAEMPLHCLRFVVSFSFFHFFSIFSLKFVWFSLFHLCGLLNYCFQEQSDQDDADDEDAAAARASIDDEKDLDHGAESESYHEAAASEAGWFSVRNTSCEPISIETVFQMHY